MSQIVQKQREDNLKILSALQDLVLKSTPILDSWVKTRVGNKDVLKNIFDIIKSYAKARQAQTAEMQAVALIIEKAVQRGDYSHKGAAKDYSELGVIDNSFLLEDKPKQIKGK